MGCRNATHTRWVEQRLGCGGGGTRLVPCAIGTDTGGSVRLPAAWCGIVGLKTTVGQISNHGILPLAPTLDTPGPMTRSVEDAALLFNLFQGFDPLDPRTAYRQPDDPMPSLKRGVAAACVLPSFQKRNRTVSIREVLAAYDTSIELLRGLGARIIEIALPCKFGDFAALTGQVIGAEGYAILGDFVDRLDLPIDEAVRPRIWIGKSMSARDYLGALAKREKLKQQFDVAFGDIDALLTPTTATAAIPVADADQSKSPAIFTRMVNLLDLCALSLPNGFTATGLPTSLHTLSAEAITKPRRFALAIANERATNWLSRLPPLA